MRTCLLIPNHILYLIIILIQLGQKTFVIKLIKVNIEKDFQRKWH